MSTRRTLSYAGLAILIVVYLLVIQGLGVALSQGTDAGYGTFPDLDTVLRAITTPVAVSVLFVAVVISVMRIWPEVLHENHPVRQWVWVVPALMVAGALVVLDYENLGAADTARFQPCAGARRLSSRRACRRSRRMRLARHRWR